ncbi:hypothetical protein DMN91_000795 [Ooceraea biroi]|uniref:Uncharacterized protein n=1 Tax=Ooceraea biroi TaxID=2015173 RepID=A0A3L8E2X6_OOCBI|nr:hypothetical protein DMN91_000795 [Ooceraea biroi]
MDGQTDASIAAVPFSFRQERTSKATALLPHGLRCPRERLTKANSHGSGTSEIDISVSQTGIPGVAE